MYLIEQTEIFQEEIRALLVIIALGFCMAIMISIPTGVLANQQKVNDTPFLI